MSEELAYLRADVSDALGLGHISRAIGVAKALERGGIRAVVYCRHFGKTPGKTLSKLELHKDLVRDVPSEAFFLRELENGAPKYLVVDLVEGPAYAELLDGLKKSRSRFKAICFDSFYDDQLKFDLYVGPSFDGSTIHATGISGLKYFVFPEELRVRAPKKETSNAVRRVLITLGGRDPHRVEPMIARALCAAHPDVRFTAVVGPGFAAEERAELAALAREHKNLELAVEPEHLGDLYLAHDVAVASGGQTRFETALFGIPTMIVANNDSEESYSRVFEKWGMNVVFGKADGLDAGAFARVFSGLIGDRARLDEMTRKCRERLDARGGENVIEHIKKNLS